MLPEDYTEPQRLEDNKRGGVGVNGNLRPATAGEVRNPMGKPPGTLNRSTIVRKWLEAQSKGEDGIELPNYDRITMAALAKALTGDIPAFKELMDSGYGKTPDKQELSGPDGGALQAIVRKVIDPKVIE